MPGMQFFGTEPEWKSRGTRVAEAMGEGIESYRLGKERREKREAGLRSEARAERGLDIQTLQLKKQLEGIDYNKKKEAYDLLMKRAELLGDEESSTRLFSSPVFQELENSLGISHIVDLDKVKEGEAPKTVKFRPKTTPTYSQEQAEAGILSDIKRGSGTTANMMGQMIPYTIDSREKAMDYLSFKKQDPSKYKSALDAKFGSMSGATTGKYKKGQTEVKDGITYTYDGKVWRY